MNMHMIAVLYHGKDNIGFRILDSDTGKTMDADKQSIKNAIMGGHKIHNLEIGTDGEIKGSNGALNRYAHIDNGVVTNFKQSPLVVLNQISDLGYTVCDHSGNMKKIIKADAVKYADTFSIANGMVKTRDGLKFISSISGYYDIVQLQPSAQASENKQPAVNKNIDQSNIVDSSTTTNKKTDEVAKSNADKQMKSENSASVKMYFSNDQLSVLKKYYTWANLEQSEAESELNTINDNIKTGRLIASPILEELVGVLNTSYSISQAFGNELAEHIIGFIMTKTPMPKSLLVKCSEVVASDIQGFFNKVFFEYSEGVNEIYKGESLFHYSAQELLKYVGTVDILGEYKPFISEEYQKSLETAYKYTMVTRADIPNIKLIVAFADICSNYIGEVGVNLRLDRRPELKKRIYAFAWLYFANNIYFEARYHSGASSAPAGSEIVKVISSAEADRLNFLNRTEKLGRTRNAILIALGLNKEFYSEDEVKAISKKEIYRLEDSDIQIGERSERFIGSPLNYRSYTINDIKGMHTAYTIVKKLVTEDDTVVNNFCNFVKDCNAKIESKIADDQRRKDKEELDKIVKIEQERRKAREELERKAREEREQREKESARERAESAESAETAETAKDSIPQAPKKQDKSSDGQSSNGQSTKEDILDTYKRLLASSTVLHNEYCFRVVNDIVNRGLTYNKMSPKQQYRVREAVGILQKEFGLEGLSGSAKQKAATKTDSRAQNTDTVNNQYILSDHQDIKDKVTRLVSKSDSVEMQEVLRAEPLVLKICYSILRYGKASDKQLKHVDAAIRILDEQ